MRISWRLLCAAVCVQGLVRLSLATLGFPATRRLFLRPKRIDVPGAEVDPHQQASIQRAVRKTAAVFYRRRPDCLPRAITMFYLLKHRGLEAHFCLGVRTNPFSAHAWVECAGQVLADSPGEVLPFRPITRLSSVIRSFPAPSCVT